MAQKSVELIIGKLVTDDGFRHRFQRDRTGVLEELEFSGFTLTSVEKEVVLSLIPSIFENFARRVDPRIRKIDLKAGAQKS